MFRASSRGEPQPGAERRSTLARGTAQRATALLALGLSLGACSVVLNFGDEKQLASSGGTAGASSGGTAGAGAQGASGGTSGGGGSAGSSGAGVGGNSGGGVGGGVDAGLCASDASPVGPDSGKQLFFYLDAADQSGGVSDGDCSKDDSRLVPLPGTMPADCDFAFGAGKEWIQMFREESIACVGCLSPTPDLWVEFLLAYKTPVSADGSIVFQPMRGAADAKNAAYPAIMIDSQHHPGLKCGSQEQYSQVTLNESAIVMLTYEYDFAARVARLYLRATSEGYAIGQLQNPLVELTCDCTEPADGFFMRGVAGTGELLFDEFRAAENHTAIDDSY